jgi:phosphotransferase system HPr (HPr) family protein
MEIRNPSGLHARPAATLVKAAAGFEAEITVTNLTRDASRAGNAKSLLAILSLGASAGHRIRITADGPDAERAVETLGAMVGEGLGEPLLP